MLPCSAMHVPRRFRTASNISEVGRWPIYASLYSNKGVILGWLAFTNDLAGTNDLHGVVAWVKLGQTGRKLYPNGFTWPATGKSISVNGALLQEQAIGYGVFVGTNQSGAVFRLPKWYRPNAAVGHEYARAA